MTNLKECYIIIVNNEKSKVYTNKKVFQNNLNYHKKYTDYMNSLFNNRSHNLEVYFSDINTPLTLMEKYP